MRLRISWPATASSVSVPDTLSIGSLGALDQRAGPQASTAAHRNDRALAGGTLQFVDRLGNQAASGRAQRMPQRRSRRHSD